jgi:acetyl-CoA carboxylase carboxyltransferase component
MAPLREAETRMGWQPELDELRERERQARELGGADKVKRQHDAGKLTIRERVDGLVDQAAFTRSARSPAAPRTTRRAVSPSWCRRIA